MLMASSLAIAWKENDLESFLAFFNASEIWLKSMKDAERMVVNSKSCNQLTEGFLSSLMSLLVLVILPLLPLIIVLFSRNYENGSCRSIETNKRQASGKRNHRLLQTNNRASKAKETSCVKKKRTMLKTAKSRFGVELKAILAELSLRKTSSVAKVDGNVNSEKVKDVIREMDYWKRQESPKVMLDSFCSESFGGTSDYQHLHEQEMVKKATVCFLDRWIVEVMCFNVGAEKLGKTDLSEDLRVIASNDQKRPLRSSFGTRGRGKLCKLAPRLMIPKARCLQ
uniref:Uncharacterized protein n=1 Tax=Ditylenchus dipsaci TaxID=166011 RepID=A0A915E0P1_9BILA